ncbi:MAG: hypothetical protein LBV51_05635 [Acholeplasmatales bacterium]|jgi:hypothetical protein|nr:hypothetical protein [Acholeplasmatales bacterium]
MNRNVLKSIAIFVLSLFVLLGLASCKKDDVTKYDVKFLDGVTVLKTVQVEEGALVTRPIDLESKQGFTFINWFSTPSKNHTFDFSKEITGDTNVYGGFSEYQEDVRQWYVVGSGAAPLLVASNWGANIGAQFALNKPSATKNEFTITLDLIEGDEFQFAGPSWIHKRGFGYLETINSGDTQVFDGTGGGYGDVVSKGRNILVKLSGNYTFTLKTYPADDTEDTTNGSYVPGNPVYNLGTYDTISWVRNGDAAPLAASTENWYIKGSDITGWADLHTPYTKFVKVGSEYSLEIYLKNTEQFMFTSAITDHTTNVEGGQAHYLNGGVAGATTALWETLFTGANNWTPKESATYVFVINASVPSEPKITASLKNSTIPSLMTEQDFYVNGTFDAAGSAWGAVTNDAINPDFKLLKVGETNVYEIKNVVLKVGDELIVQGMTKGSVVGLNNWGNSFGFSYLKQTTVASISGNGGTNIKIVTPGIYNISFDAYNRSIKIAEGGNDIYLKGGFEGCGNGSNWDHGFVQTLKFSAVLGEEGLYILEIDLTNGGSTVSWGLAVYDKGVVTGNGTFVGRDRVGDTGDAVILGETGNPTVAEGHYYFVYNAVTNIVNVYITNPFA